MLEIGVLITSVLLNGLLGFIVYSKNSESVTNKLFATLCAAFIVWSTATYFSLHPVFLSQLIWVRLVLCSATFLSFVTFVTLSNFPGRQLQTPRRKLVFIAGWVLFVMGLTLTPLVFANLIIEDGKASPVPNFGVAIFAITVVALLGKGVWNLIKKYKESFDRERAQIGLVLFGLAGAFSLILFTNFFFVLIVGSSSLVSLGAACTLVFSGILYYAVARFRLFDIRATVARLVAYVASILLFGLIYGFLFFAASSFIPQEHVFAQRVIYISLALVATLLYPSVRRLFAKVSNKILYQDAYDPQQFFQSLNRILVSNAELDQLLTKTLRLMGDTFKSEASAVALFVQNDEHMRIVQSQGHSFISSDLAEIRNLLESSDLRGQVIVADLLGSGEGEELTKLLHKSDIAVVARLRGGKGQGGEDQGFVVLGHKKSSRPYVTQDVRVVEATTNELVIAVQNAFRFEEIRSFNRTLEEKIEDATRELRRKNERLRLLDQTKDDFISMASHQLRTPLTSVKGYVSMVLDGDAGKVTELQKKLLTQSFLSSQRMVYLISDLLNVSRLRTGKFEIEPVESKLADVIESEVKQLQETAKGRELALTYKKPEHFPTLMLDENKLRQVIMNFIDNAIYYTPAKGHITINLIDRSDSVEFTVVDDGIGVPKREQHHLFSKFYRAHNAKRARPDGTGLGLFMAKKVIIAQGGAVIFKSQEGKGSTFGFTFPKKKLVSTSPKHADK